MTASTAAGCISTLKQQQECSQHHLKQTESLAPIAHPPEAAACTVVENGRVVVKPLRSDAESEQPS